MVTKICVFSLFRIYQNPYVALAWTFFISGLVHQFMMAFLGSKDFNVLTIAVWINGLACLVYAAGLKLHRKLQLPALRLSDSTAKALSWGFIFAMLTLTRFLLFTCFSTVESW